MRNYGAKPIIKLRTEATQTRMPNLNVYRDKKQDVPTTAHSPLLHPVASLCALSAHTLYKAGEVLTYPGQVKQKLREEKQSEAFAVRMTFAMLAEQKSAGGFS